MQAVEISASSDIKALLLTDVVDSTQLSATLGDGAMAQLWAAHDRLARDLLPPWRGREIDKTDGMLLMFDTAADAAGYALAYHRALATLPVPLKARAGLHVGPVILRENSAEDVARGAKPLEVDGLAKPTAARVMSLAVGGQTLITPDAQQALGATVLALQSHGHWVMKGVPEPLELFEVAEAGSPFSAPPDGEKVYRVVRVGERWLPVKELPNNLPQQTTSFIGRDRELAEVRALLPRTRLLTLLGMGGLGKTRLSLQVAAEVMPDYPDGVWFFDLAPIRDPALVVSEAAQVLGVREEPGRTLLQSVCAHLKTLRVLIIVDNCEHLMRASADLVNAHLRAAPGVRAIASSREALRIPGEQAYPVLPLPLPGRGDGLAALQRSTAVRLFVERAQLHKPSFVLTEREAPAVAELVARLEGIPLALELAAARVRMLSVADINLRLKDRYKLLTGGGRVLFERQQTLRALVDWSYDLLEEPERLLLQRLSVFLGGFDLPAAEAVCADDQLGAEDIMEVLNSLVEKSLVAVVQIDEQGRFRMLETIREYADGKLSEQGGRTLVAARHCLYYFDLSKQARNGMQGPQQGVWLDRLEVEQDNLRAAMALPQVHGSEVDPFIVIKMAVALQNFWIMRGGAGEGRAAMRAMLANPAVQASAMARAHALYVSAALAWTQGDLDEALQGLLLCLELRRQDAPPVDVATTLSTLAVTRLSSGDIDGARSAGAEAVELFRQCGYRVAEAIALVQLGQVELHLAHPELARQHVQAALAIATDIKHPETEGEAELLIGEIETECGQQAQAERRFQRSLAVCVGAGDRRGEANARWALGRLDLRAAQLDAALPQLREALSAFDGFEMRGPWVGCLEDHAVLALAWGDPGLACGLAAAAQQARERSHLARSPQAQARFEQWLAELRDVLGADGYAAAWAQAQAWETTEIRLRALAVSPHGATAPADRPGNEPCERGIARQAARS